MQSDHLETLTVQSGSPVAVLYHSQKSHKRNEAD